MSDKGLFIDITLRRGEFDLRVETVMAARRITAVFGPSGAGKSSLLRAIAGFETPQSGRISVGPHTVFDSEESINVPPHKRGVGYMSQEAELFSHLDIRGNLAFAHKRAPEGGPDVNDIVSAFDIEDLLGKRAEQLSGGERQRAALARTVLSRPSLLMLDEPLAALDEGRKAALMPSIRRLADDFEMAVLFVSHNLSEVGSLADDIICLQDGQVTLAGAALDILPKIQSDAHRLGGHSSWFDAEISYCDALNHAATLSLSEEHKLIVPLSDTMRSGGKCRLAIRADNVSIALTPPQNISIQNKLDVRVKSVTQDGARVMVILYLPDVDKILPELYACITPMAQAALQLKPGQAVTALVKSVSLSR